MTKYIKGKDGKFAGSIGDGKTNVPTAPTPPVVPDTQPRMSKAAPEVEAMWTRFQAMQGQRFDTALHATRSSIEHHFPTAKTFSIAKVYDPNEDPMSYSELAGVYDADGTPLYERYDVDPHPSGRRTADFYLETEYSDIDTEHKVTAINMNVLHTDDIMEYEDYTYEGVCDDDATVFLFEFTLNPQNTSDEDSSTGLSSR